VPGRALLLGLALLAVLTGCGQGQLPQGPLGAWPENHDTVGQPVQRGGADTIGFDGFYNGGTKPAVIDRVVIVSPRHIRLIGAYITLGGPIGNWTTFPPVFPTSAKGRHDNRCCRRRGSTRRCGRGCRARVSPTGRGRARPAGAAG